MVKYFCDACGSEMQSGNTFTYLCHIDDYFSGRLGYVDNDMNRVSGRSVSVDLCNACYNLVVVAAIKKLRQLQDAGQAQD